MTLEESNFRFRLENGRFAPGWEANPRSRAENEGLGPGHSRPSAFVVALSQESEHAWGLNPKPETLTQNPYPKI